MLPSLSLLLTSPAPPLEDFGQPGVTPVSKLLENVFGVHAAATELRAVLHQFEDGSFPFPINRGCVGQINHQAATLQRTAGRAGRGSAQLRNPRIDKSSFHH